MIPPAAPAALRPEADDDEYLDDGADAADEFAEEEGTYDAAPPPERPSMLENQSSSIDYDDVPPDTPSAPRAAEPPVRVSRALEPAPTFDTMPQRSAPAPVPPAPAPAPAPVVRMPSEVSRGLELAPTFETMAFSAAPPPNAKGALAAVAQAAKPPLNKTASTIAQEKALERAKAAPGGAESVQSVLAALLLALKEAGRPAAAKAVLKAVNTAANAHKGGDNNAKALAGAPAAHAILRDQCDLTSAQLQTIAANLVAQFPASNFAATLVEPWLAAAPAAEPEPDPADGSEWWVTDENGEYAGPFTPPELRSKHAAGSLDPDALFFREGMTEWLPLSEVAAEIRIKLGGAPSPAKNGMDDLD